ncbi:MAG: hypothetical protein ACRD2O_12430 [Terriglobia bacterium]
MAKKLIIVIALVALGAAGFAACRTRAAVKFGTPYQAVLLDNGQVYYGKIQGLETAYPVLTDVYYVKSQVNPETKEVSNVLIRRGNEWHAPDRMFLNANHIVLMEPVNPKSKVAQLIAASRK